MTTRRGDESIATGERAGQFEFIRLIPPADSAGPREATAKREQIIVIPAIIEHSLLINCKPNCPALRESGRDSTNCGRRQSPRFSPPTLSGLLRFAVNGLRVALRLIEFT